MKEIEKQEEEGRRAKKKKFFVCIWRVCKEEKSEEKKNVF